MANADPGAQLRAIGNQIRDGEIAAARAQLARLEQAANDDVRLLQGVAQLYLHCEEHADAFRCYARSVQLRPQDPQLLYNVATSCVAMGDVERAEQLFDQVIALNPADAGAYQNRSMLRTWRADRNHVDELLRALARLPSGSSAAVPLRYALAKEYEDLGEFAASFEQLRRGAAGRRALLSYQVTADVEVMDHIRQRFDARRLASAPAAREATHRPLFVLGLPRSGTTLVERILSSHSRVGSLGETNAFAFALIRLAGGQGTKIQMVDRAAALDFDRLGELYRASIAGHGRTQPLLVNKMPLNFLYLGIIRLALPEARLVHLRRHPLDSCYAMFKTLFRMGYPFSYSLEDLGHYYLAYHRLMAHWRAVLPDGLLDVDYESLVSAPQDTIAGLLRHAGLAWEESCLAFHDNRAPAATASATQVRQPLYRSSVARWRHYSQQLEPLARFLDAHGIDVD